MTTVTTQAELDAAVAAGDTDGPIVVGGGVFRIAAGVGWIEIQPGARSLIALDPGSDIAIDCREDANPAIYCLPGSDGEIACLSGSKPFIYLERGSGVGVCQHPGSQATIVHEPPPIKTEPEAT